MSEETITVTFTRGRLESLVDNVRRLRCLEADGVDNWDWYMESWTEEDEIPENHPLSLLVQELGGAVHDELAVGLQEENDK